jgi:hypothetical protein
VEAIAPITVKTVQIVVLLICPVLSIASKRFSPIWQIEATETIAVSDNTEAQNASGPG